jgi:phosphinothricin acetyltransferase
MAPPPDFLIRDSEPSDLPAIAAIYGHWALNGRASFELEPPGLAEMTRRREKILKAGYPYLTAANRESGEVLGYAYAGAYRPRLAYRFACEDSIYLAPQAQNFGVGKALLKILIERCEAIGLRLMVAVIGGSDNKASIRLHEALGFSRAGLLPAIGWKHGRWVDSVLMTRPLGEGSATAPAERAPRG